ncbi:MAG: hypothetical protein VYC92_02140, partial [SAR324 cluster bacterium]|nr:hypothetical protein [SAR324 cluster bacterium]
YFVIADTKFLAAYAISLLLFGAGLFWIIKQKLWLPDENLNEKIVLESALPAKVIKSAKDDKGVKSTKNKKG